MTVQEIERVDIDRFLVKHAVIRFLDSLVISPEAANKSALSPQIVVDSKPYITDTVDGGTK